MKLTSYKIVASTCALAVVSTFGASAVAGAVTPKTATSDRLPTVISQADAGISHRQTDLDKLSAKVTTAKKLSTTNRQTLLNEIATTKTNLTNLQTQIHADTTVAAAKTDHQRMYTDFRIYALIIPKDNLIKVSDDQLSRQTNLLLAASLLGNLVHSSPDSATLTPKLADATAKLAAAQKLSQAAQTQLLTLQPSDYNSNHKVLVSIHSSLQTAHSDDQIAFHDLTDIAHALGVNKN